MIGSLGFPEIAIILLVALLVFGPKRLPEIGRTLGKGLGEFRRASNELRRTFNAEISVLEQEQEGAKATLSAPAPQVLPRIERVVPRGPAASALDGGVAAELAEPVAAEDMTTGTEDTSATTCAREA